MEKIYIALAVAFFLFLVHLFFIEKLHKQDRKLQRVVFRDILGSPIHLIFVIADSFVFIGLFNYLKNITKEQSLVLITFGFALMILGVVLYRMLHLWFEKDHSVEDKIKRERKF